MNISATTKKNGQDTDHVMYTRRLKQDGDTIKSSHSSFRTKRESSTASQQRLPSSYTATKVSTPRKSDCTNGRRKNNISQKSDEVLPRARKHRILVDTDDKEPEFHGDYDKSSTFVCYMFHSSLMPLCPSQSHECLDRLKFAEKRTNTPRKASRSSSRNKSAKGSVDVITIDSSGDEADDTSNAPSTDVSKVCCFCPLQETVVPTLS